MRPKPLSGIFGASAKVRHTTLFGRNIKLWRRSGTRQFHAEISNGSSERQPIWIEIKYCAKGDPGAGSPRPPFRPGIRDYSNNRVRLSRKGA